MPQPCLWQELAKTPPEFVLYGGTAIGLYFGHRPSVDFDFFGNRDFDPDQSLITLKALCYFGDGDYLPRLADAVKNRL